MVNPSWLLCIVLLRWLGQNVLDAYVVRRKGLGMDNNYNSWPKNWKFEIVDFLFLSLYGSSYTMQKKELFLKICGMLEMMGMIGG